MQDTQVHSHQKVEELASQWAALKEADPKLRIRNAARELSVSEAELLATQCGKTVTRLKINKWKDLFGQLNKLGTVMSLTRNDDAVHEKHGEFLNVRIMGPMGLINNDLIDLRLFMDRWKFAFAVEEDGARGTRRSLQMFDNEGVAMLKVFLTEQSNVEAYYEIVSSLRSEDQTPYLEVDAPAAPVAETPDSEIDVEGFQEAWKALQDTHDFFNMTQKYGVTRSQALRLAPQGYTEKIANDSLVKLLEAARDAELPIMVFVPNAGCIQIHSGPIKKLVRVGEWYNVLDPDFNLHLRDGAIASTWIVRKPTTEGIVTSLEVYDADNNTIAMLFGVRSFDTPEDQRWVSLLEPFLNT